MKRLMALMVMLFCMCGNAWGLSTERSGLIYYPTDGASAIAINSAIESRGYPATIKFTFDGSGVSKAYILTSGVTFSELVTLEFENRAELVPDSGVSIWVHSADHIDCLETQAIETGDGELKFTTGGGTITPNNYGAVGDGTTLSQDVPITQAANSGCNDVLVPAGTYMISYPVPLRTDNVVFRGIKGASILKYDAVQDTKDAAWLAATGLKQRIGILNVIGDRITVRDLFIDENYRGTGQDETGDYYIHDIIIGGYGFSETGRGDYCTIENNDIWDTGGDVISVFSTNVDDLTINNNRITTSYIVNNWTTAGSLSQCIAAGGDNLIVTNNKIYGAHDDAIAMHGGNQYIGVLCTGNLITTTGGRILANGRIGGVISDNTIVYIQDGASAIYLALTMGASRIVTESLIVNNNSVYIQEGVVCSTAIRYHGGGNRVQISNNNLYTYDNQGAGITINDRSVSDYSSGASIYNGTSIGGDNIVVKGNTIDNFTTGVIMSGNIIRSGTCQSGTSSTVTLEAGEESLDHFFDFMYMYISDGTGAGQYRDIETYDGTTKVATITENWDIIPDSTSVYNITNFGRNIQYFDNVISNATTGFVLVQAEGFKSMIGDNRYAKVETLWPTYSSGRDYFQDIAVHESTFTISNTSDFSSYVTAKWDGVSDNFYNRKKYYIIGCNVFFSDAPNTSLDIELYDGTTKLIDETISSGVSTDKLVFFPVELPINTDTSGVIMRMINHTGTNTVTTNVIIKLRYIIRYND